MENQEFLYQPTKEEIKRNKINLHRHERIGATYGNNFMRTIAILFTIYMILDFFLSFMSFATYQYDVYVIVSSLYWMFIMVIRFIPNLVTCIALWIIFTKGHNAREVSVLGFKMIQIIMIFQAVFSFITLIVGSIIIVSSSNQIIPMDGLTKLGTFVLILSMFIFVQLVKIIIHVILTISVASILDDKKGLNRFKFGYLSSVLCIVIGLLLILNIIPSYNIIFESIYSLPIAYNRVYPLFETILLNPLNIIFYGIFIGFGGCIGLLYIRKQNKIDEIMNEE